jgi:hypothetical protein
MSILFPTREEILRDPNWRRALQSDTFGIANPDASKVIVEQDNMARHEWPICREKGEPVRPGYSHISMVSGAI